MQNKNNIPQFALIGGNFTADQAGHIYDQVIGLWCLQLDKRTIEWSLKKKFDICIKF